MLSEESDNSLRMFLVLFIKKLLKSSVSCLKRVISRQRSVFYHEETINKSEELIPIGMFYLRFIEVRLCCFN